MPDLSAPQRQAAVFKEIFVGFKWGAARPLSVPEFASISAIGPWRGSDKVNFRACVSIKESRSKPISIALQKDCF